MVRLAFDLAYRFIRPERPAQQDAMHYFILDRWVFDSTEIFMDKQRRFQVPLKHRPALFAPDDLGEAVGAGLLLLALPL